MNYSFQALIQVFIPFSIILLFFTLVYVLIAKKRKKSLINCLRTDLKYLVSIISTLLVFVTLLEMQTERVQLYKPFIVLEAGTGGCTFRLNEDENSATQFAIFTVDNSDESLSGDVTIQIKNIGVGVANKVQMEFFVDSNANSNRYFLFEEHYPAFSLAQYPKNGIITVDSKYMEENSFLYESNSVGSKYMEEKSFLLHYQSFILPNAQDTLSLKLPISYLSAVRHYYSYCHNIDVPPLYLIIRYEDVQGVKYSQKFYLEFSVRYVFHNGQHFLYYTFTPLENQTIHYAENTQYKPPEQFDYSQFQSYWGAD